MRYVLDTGALVALERRKPRAMRLLRLGAGRAVDLVIPYPVLAEWWRGRSDDREAILDMARVVALEPAARAAGAALARLPRVDAALTIDAIVIATAAMLDATVVSSDVDDLARFAQAFPSVRVLAV